MPNVGPNGFGRGFGTEARPDPANPSNPKSSLDATSAPAPAPAPFAEPDPAFENSNASPGLPTSSFVRLDRDDHAELDLGRPAEASKKLNAGGESGGVSGRGSSTGAVAAEETREAVEVACARARRPRARLAGNRADVGEGVVAPTLNSNASGRAPPRKSSSATTSSSSSKSMGEPEPPAGLEGGESTANGARGGWDGDVTVAVVLTGARGCGWGGGGVSAPSPGGWAAEGARVVGAGRADVPDEACNASSSLSSLDE